MYTHALEEPTMTRRKLLLFILFTLLLMLPDGTASADIGPKPTMEFTFEYETGEDLYIVDGVLLQCADPTCSDPYPLEQLGPQNFSCDQTGCSSMAYGYAGDNMLEITFSDGVTRRSNQFGKQHFDAEYTVTVYEDELVVVETGGRVNPMGALFAGAIAAACIGGALLILLLVSLGVLIARGGREEPVTETSRRWIVVIWVIGILFFVGALLLSLFNIISWSLPLTMLIEAVALAVYCAIRRQPKLAMLTLNLSGNLLTQLVLWFLLVNYASGGLGWIIILVTEALIVLIEAAILYWPQRKTLTFKEALGVSFMVNLLSFTVGIFIPV
jgi:hypothetical protein